MRQYSFPSQLRASGTTTCGNDAHSVLLPRNTLKNFCTKIHPSNGIVNRMLQETHLKSTKQMTSINNVTRQLKNPRSIAETKPPQWGVLCRFCSRFNPVYSRLQRIASESSPSKTSILPTPWLEIDRDIEPQIDRSFEDDISESDAYHNID